MTKTQFAAALAEELEIPKAEAAQFLAAFEEIVVTNVKKGEPVMLSGFVKFARVDRKARVGRNPATGEPVKIKAKRAVKVSALKGFKDAVLASKK